MMNDWPTMLAAKPLSKVGPNITMTPAKPTATPSTLRQLILSSVNQWASTRVNSGTVVMMMPPSLLSISA